LATLFRHLPADFPAPIVVVQHMPPVFTSYLAERLDVTSPLEVREAVDREHIGKGQVRIAPGNFHIELAGSSGVASIRLHQGPPENSCRPAVDVLFRSVAAEFGPAALAVVLTGMGQDGLLGCHAIHEAGGSIVVQDESTSVVWGMPGAVAGAELADRILPLASIAGELKRRVMVGWKPLKVAAAPGGEP
jgi:two-component system chemotaxis response regulator CheB